MQWERAQYGPAHVSPRAITVSDVLGSILDVLACLLDTSLGLFRLAFGFKTPITRCSTGVLLGLAIELLGLVPDLVSNTHCCLLILFLLRTEEEPARSRQPGTLRTQRWTVHPPGIGHRSQRRHGSQIAFTQSFPTSGSTRGNGEVSAVCRTYDSELMALARFNRIIDWSASVDSNSPGPTTRNAVRSPHMVPNVGEVLTP